MSFQVGQILSNDDIVYYDTSSYLSGTSSSGKIQDLKTLNEVLKIEFTDKRIEYNFQSGSYYYVKIKIACAESNQIITFQLMNGQEAVSSVDQYVDKVTIPLYTSVLNSFSVTDTEDPVDIDEYTEKIVTKTTTTTIRRKGEIAAKYATIQFIIAPNVNYSYLGIILQRQQEDFIIDITSSDSAADSVRKLGREITVSDFQIFKINNLIPNQINNNAIMSKIGIQGPVGMLMCINGEGIRIGPSGIYEIKNGYKVFFLGVIRRSSENKQGIFAKDSFIIDYQYDKNDETEKEDIIGSTEYTQQQITTEDTSS